MMKQTAVAGGYMKLVTFLPLSPNLPALVHLPAKQLCRWRSLPTISIYARKKRKSLHTFVAYSSLDDKPLFDYEDYHLNSSYLEEQDIITFLDPPKSLVPLDPSSYNPARYLWKKIDDIPEERRHRLLSLLKPSLISRAWEVAGTKYDDPNFATKSAPNLLSASGDDAKMIEFWNCRSSAGPAPIAWFNYFKKAVYRCNDRRTCGRFIGGSVLTRLSNYFPMYFLVKQLNEVMSTEQPCDLAYEFGDGISDIYNYPKGFPKPACPATKVGSGHAKHPWPFNDHVVVYIRHIGPGVLVGQAWQEGEALEQVPKKLCGEILMVKDN